ncbi:hypothetical protein BDV26DRAFT_274756 [Aspergillus bertholletiae]|uniref:Uncharacterized protein n=1 Tax=Aspergillus bertholletiae TaxID=1226010 RepID=A0A5N7ARZ8_9EURO|nr:hypothetical protein BDV26DRAFT_274756 [Aspergillus bertholletiae]
MCLRNRSSGYSTSVRYSSMSHYKDIFVLHVVTSTLACYRTVFFAFSEMSNNAGDLKFPATSQ